MFSISIPSAGWNSSSISLWPIHPYFREQLLPRLQSVHYTKTWRGIKIPGRPRSLRRLRQERLIGKLHPDLGVLWNRFGDLSSLNGLRKHGARVIHYEHGAAWLAPLDQSNREFLSGIDSVICASHAAKRVLQLRWGFSGRIEVVLNCLRPGLIPDKPVPRSLPTDRPVRLGIAARLIPLKGVGIALHALRALLDNGRQIELHIAGTGPFESFLAGRAGRLELGTTATFHSSLQDMSEFYRMIDLLLVPSVREPFGLVIVEAAAHGCPAICSLVDGIPEAMIDGQTGICLKPTLDLSAGYLFGGTAEDFPAAVYAPDTDRLIEPRFLDPLVLASSIGDLLDDPERYSRLSAAAIQHALANYSATEYARQLRAAFIRK
jgi:glycosyltransferase involved in cell wall biosynthesis